MQIDVNVLKQEIAEASEVIKAKCGSVPEVGIILGTGLGGLTKAIEIESELLYNEIPHFPVSTVESHAGRLLFGTISGRKVLAMQGRFHYYEGYSLHKITFPIRVMKALGINILVLSNACGSLNPVFRKSEIMLMDDHINLLGDNPLIGLNDESFGPRFVDMSEPYSQRIIKLAEQIALDQGIKLQKGVYAALPGPSLETRAEYRFLRTIGADVIGMSTIPECIVARQMGMEVAGFSIITDECYPDALKPVSLAEILAAAEVAEPRLVKIILELIPKL